MAKIKHYLSKLTKRIRNNQGFSLTEIMITMSIVGAVATIASAKIDDVLPMARDAQPKANIHQVQTALNLYYNDHEQYPVSSGNEPTAAGWEIIREVLESPDNTYIPEMPTDPLNTDQYVFKYWSNGQKFEITYDTEDQNDRSPLHSWGL